MYALHLESPDGKRIALSSESGQVFIFDLESGSLTAIYTSHVMAVRSLAWSYDGQVGPIRYFGSMSVQPKYLATASGKPGSGAVASLIGHSAWVLSADISPEGHLAVSGSADKNIKVWDLAARASVSTTQESGEVWGVAWRLKPAPTGSAGASISGGQDSLVRWWRSAGSGV
ncbi:WD40 repeat-like protein [Boletus coccyginus]|nr:WD40 repeat-like protein [Boletus coccyginus]